MTMRTVYYVGCNIQYRLACCIGSEYSVLSSLVFTPSLDCDRGSNLIACTHELQFCDFVCDPVWFLQSRPRYFH